MSKASSQIIIRTGAAFLRLRDEWAGQGGLFAGHMPAIAPGQPDYFLIVPADATLFGQKLAYGGYGKKTEGADHKQDGVANTRALLADGNEHPAAKFCADFDHGGHKDWSLPAQRELAVVQAVMGDHIPAGDYWSSTQYSPGNAWRSTFPLGYQDFGYKDYKAGVVPVRRVLAI